LLKELLDDLKSDEGWRPFAYVDSLGFLTIGYGFLVDDRSGVGLPLSIGEAWLKVAAEERWVNLLGRLPWLETQPEDVQRALGNMAYQLGVDGVLGFKLMLEALERGDRETAAENALKSKWHEQTPRRAERVAALMRGTT
jgi:lysozyme